MDECIDRVIRGESVPQVLSDYPELAPEIKPPLRTAFPAKKAGNGPSGLRRTSTDNLTRE